MNAKQAPNKHRPPISFYNLYGDQGVPRSDDKWRYKFWAPDPQPGASGSSSRMAPYPHYPPLPVTISGYSIQHELQQPQQGPSTHLITIPNQNGYGGASRRQARVWDPIEVAEAFQTFGKGNYSINSTLGTHRPIINVVSDRSSLTTSSSRTSHVEIRGITFTQPGEFEGNSLPSTPQSRRTTLASLSPEPISRDISPICSICFDNSNDFPRCGPTLRCTHGPTICIPCMEGHISHSVLTDGLTSISCPIPGCRQILEYEDVLRGAKGDQRCLNRYEALLLRRLLGNDLNFVWCKNSACSWGQIHEGGAEYPLVVCDQCNSQSCFTHDIPWHTGSTCKEYEARMKDKDRQLLTKNKKKQQQRQEEHETEEFIRKNTKRCPNQLCGHQVIFNQCNISKYSPNYHTYINLWLKIQKNGGCNHMTCRPPAGCGHEFCWLCLVDYRLILDEGPHRHEFGCEEYGTPYPSVIRILD